MIFKKKLKLEDSEYIRHSWPTAKKDVFKAEELLKYTFKKLNIEVAKSKRYIKNHDKLTAALKLLDLASDSNKFQMTTEEQKKVIEIIKNSLKDLGVKFNRNEI